MAVPSAVQLYEAKTAMATSSPARSATETDLELQQLLELSRATRTMQRLQEAELRQNAKTDSRPSSATGSLQDAASRSSRASFRTPPPMANGRTPPPPTRTPPSAGGLRRPSGMRQGSFRSGRGEDEERPRPPPVPQGTLRQQGWQNATPVRGAPPTPDSAKRRGERTTPSPALYSGRGPANPPDTLRSAAAFAFGATSSANGTADTQGAQSHRRDSGSSTGGSRPSSAAERRHTSRPEAADAEAGVTRAIGYELPPEADGDAESPESEQDMGWEQELRRTLGTQLREMEGRRRAAMKRIATAEQAIRKVNLDQGKFERQIRKELSEAEEESKGVEKKATGQTRALSLAVEKAETALHAARADLNEARQDAELAEETKRSELQELYDQRDTEEQLNTELVGKGDMARSQRQAVEQLIQRRLNEVAAQRAELQSLGASISEAEAALEKHLQSEFKQEAAILRERTTAGCMLRCGRLVEALEAERSRAGTLEADIKRCSARLRHVEAEQQGFQQAIDLSVETSANHLRSEIEGLRKEEDLALKHLEALERQHSQRAERGLLHPSKDHAGVDLNTLQMPATASRGKLQTTTEAVVEELAEHQSMVARLFEESSAVATHANTACALQLSSPARSSSAQPSPSLAAENSSPWKRGASATSLFAMPVSSGHFNNGELDGYPWLQHQGVAAVPSWPSVEQGTSRDLDDQGGFGSPFRTTPASMPGLAGIAEHIPRNLSDAKDVATRHFDELASSAFSRINELSAKQEAERQSLEASAHAAQGACCAAATILRRAEASRWMAEAELLRLRAQSGIQAEVRDGYSNAPALSAAVQRAEAKASAAEAAALSADAAHAAVVRRAAVAGSVEGSIRSNAVVSNSDIAALQAALHEGKELPLNDVSIRALLAFTAKLEVQLAEATQEDETLKRTHVTAREVCNLRKSEKEAQREVVAASSELGEWQQSLKASWQNLNKARDHESSRLNVLRLEVAEEEKRLEEFCRDEEVAEAEHRVWASSQEAALQARVEAAHVANIEALITLDSRLDREAKLRAELKRLISSRESWEKKEVGQAMVQSSLAESASLRTSEGNELQKVYANRAKEVERLYSKHGEMLNEHRRLQADLAVARTEMRSSNSALTEVRNREVCEAASLRSELFAQEAMERQLARAAQASSASSAQYSKELAVFQGERKQYQLVQADYERIVEEQRKLHDELVSVREECARGWRRLDEEEATHLLHTEQLDGRRREQAAEATAAAAAAASDAIEAMRLRVAATSSQRGQVAQQCENLSTELREAEQNCASLRRLLDRSERVHEQPRERLQRSLAGLGPIISDGQISEAAPKEDPEIAAELAVAQAASAKASQAAFQSAGAVSVAEEEVSKLLNRLLAARAECKERAQGLTLAAEEVERTRMEHRRTESELEIVQREISVLQMRAAQQIVSVGKGVGADGNDGNEAANGLAERVRMTETLPREQMILLQHLRGSQRGGGPGSSGNGAMEALRNLREQQLHQASALKAEEDLLCSKIQHKVEDAAREAATVEQLLQHELEAAVVDREQLLAMVENGQEARQTAEQQLRWAIQCLQSSAEASVTGQPTMDNVDETMVLRMGSVMREAQRFLYEQQARLEAVQRERDEVKNRLLDTLEHLEGPEYAELVVDTASRAAVSTTSLNEDAGSQVYQQGLQLGPEAMQPSGRRRSRSPIPCNLPPTIVEEEEPPKSAR